MTLLPDPGPGGKLNTDLEGRDDKADEAAILPEYKEQSVARLSEPGSTHSSVAGELGVTPTQLKTWWLELEAAELAQLRRDNKRLTEEVAVLRKASAFFAQWAAKT